MDSPSTSPELYRVPCGRTVAGSLRPPSSKSITQRYFNLALLGRAPLTIERPLLAEDTRLYLEGLAACGFDIAHRRQRVRLTPREPPAEAEIFCGAGGTMFRFLTAALTTLEGSWRLDGVPRLRQRPVGPLIDALRALGAEIRCLGEDGFAPLEITGGSLRGGRTGLDAGDSSQFLSAILMAALAALETTTVEVSALASEPYVDLTLDAIACFGGAVRREGNVFEVRPARPAAERVTVEPDFSAAAYPAAAALLSGGTVRIEGLDRDSRQGDRRFLDLLERVGARLRWRADAVDVTAGPLRGVDADLGDMPDQVPTLAAIAPFAAGTTRITGVPHLRLKESDRLSAMARELTRAGASVQELDDGLIIPGVWALGEPPATAVEVRTYGDHRIAMSMALVGLRRPGVAIRDPDVVAKSYPGFWDDLEELLGG